MKISFFVTRTGILFFQSRVSRREREIENISHGRTRKNEANSRENSRDREFSLVSDGKPYFLLLKSLLINCITRETSSTSSQYRTSSRIDKCIDTIRQSLAKYMLTNAG